ncbi:MAG TPA: amidohydrolase family protein [Acidimicrobiales bacterium]|nr:amidohydrolase family protein [Acidimicrobiales bacterium]
MHELVIRGGTVVDGTGAPARTADVAIDAGVVTEVGDLNGTAAEHEIDADGLLVTPGVVDVHTHYDGQVTWDPLLTPSSWHGVTTLVMGNCGVGFAPVRPGSEEWLIQLMEGVEDIPGTALAEGITWGWESFPDYLDVLEQLPRVLDVGTQVPHGAVRAYVMGERGARNEPATPEDIAEMARIVKDGIAAGALGFSTSRTIMHRAVDGEPVPGTFAAEDELFGIGRALGDLGAGVFELAPAGVMGEDALAPEREVDWMRRLAAAIRRPVSFALLQHNQAPEQWRDLLKLAEEANAEGADLRPQVAGRPLNMLVGWQTFHPFKDRPTYVRLAELPLAERIVELRKPEVKAAILAEKPAQLEGILQFVLTSLDRIYPMGEPPVYEPGPDTSVAAIAAREGRDDEDVLYDLMLQHDGRELLMMALLGYSHGNLEAIKDMLLHPNTALGLSDGGAHCGVICDASTPTTMLTHFVRDRSAGERIPLEVAVRKMTSDTARLYGLGDRGVLAPGYKADVNVIDFDRLNLRLPELVFDLPGGARRLVQRADGYVATVVSGEVTFREGEPTGARPGRLVRGAR